MATTPGAYNIHGVVFQIIRTAQWSVRMTLTSPAKRLASARLTAEPRSGGDFQVRFADRRIVQQFKTRSGNRTWSLREVIDEVLPDLYRAVDLADASETRFEFVTDGRMGSWRIAAEFFDQLGKRPVPASPLHVLDDETQLRFFGKGRCSRRDLFRTICDAVRKHASAKHEAVLLTRRKVWHLLSRFRFVQTPSAAEARISTQTMLRPYVADDKAAKTALSAIIDTLLEYSAAGDVTFTPGELLQAVGIDPDAFTGTEPLREAVRQIVRREASTLVRFRPDLSVRSPTPLTHPWILACYRGPGGSGKSWMLAALASEVNGLAIFLQSSGDPEQDIVGAARRILEEVLGNAPLQSMDEMKAAIGDLAPDLPAQWLTVCIDRASLADVETLAKLPLDRWGVRVAVSVSEQEATGKALEALNAVVVDVPDFTDDELREFLRRNGRRFEDIREDMLDPMRRPLLAELYVHASAARWTPTNEYAFYDACWQRLPEERDQEDMRVIARTALAEEQHPVTLAAVVAAGITSQRIDRLQAVGWLRRNAQTVSVWHDRLLNWAVAEALVADYADDPNALAARIAYCARSQEGGEVRLGYVPMDVFWLCVHRRKLAPERVAELLTAVEQQEAFRTDLLYRELLSTVGGGIATALLVRAREAKPAESWELERYVSRALTTIFRDDESASEQAIRTALESDSRVLRAIGVRLALEFPSAALAPVLWRVYAALKRTPELPGEEHDTGIQMWNSELLFARDRAFRALVRSARLNLSWVKDLILGKPEEDLFEDALWLLSNMDGDSGRTLWFQVKDAVLAQLPSAQRALLTCIRTARDEMEVPRVIEILRGSLDLDAATAFSTLSVIAPDAAIAEFTSGDVRYLSLTRSWWLPWLMLRRPVAATQAILERIRNDARAVPDIAQFFYGHETYVDRSIAAAFLAWLNEEIARFHESANEKQHLRMTDVLHLFPTAVSASMFDAVASADATLAPRLRWLCETLDRSSEGHLKMAARDAPVLLRAVSEAEFRRLVVKRIETRGRFTTEDAEWAIACGSETVRHAVRGIVAAAARPVTATLVVAIRTLAALGDVGAVADAIMRYGGGVVHVAVPRFVRSHPPMSDEMLEGPLAALAGPDETLHARALTVLGMSQRRELLPLITEKTAVAKRGSEIRRLGLYSVADLMEPGMPVETMLGPFDDWNVHHDIIAWLLERSGSDHALAMLEELVFATRDGSFGRLDTAFGLVDDSERGRRVASRVWAEVKDWPLPMWREWWIERLVPVLRPPELRVRARQESKHFEENAIRCLRHFDSGAAFDAAAAALTAELSGRESFAALLVEVDADRAVPVLLDSFIKTDVLTVRRGIARALRSVPNRERVTQSISEMLESTDREVRAAGCDLAGWFLEIGDWKVRQRATDDFDRRVQQRALASLERRQSLRNCQELLKRLAKAENFEAWVVADALVRAGDAELLATDDELSIWNAIESKGISVHLAVERWLKKRAEDIKRDEKWETNRNREDQ
jgi:hypothetical protein